MTWDIHSFTITGGQFVFTTSAGLTYAVPYTGTDQPAMKSDLAATEARLTAMFGPLETVTPETIAAHLSDTNPMTLAPGDYVFTVHG